MYYNTSVILLPQGSKFSVAQLFIYILLLRNLAFAHFTFINTLIMLDTYPLDKWLELTSRLKLTVVLSPCNKEYNNLESSVLNTNKHLRNGTRSMAISLEVWCFIYLFNYSSNRKHKADESICL